VNNAAKSICGESVVKKPHLKWAGEVPPRFRNDKRAQFQLADELCQAANNEQRLLKAFESWRAALKRAHL